MQHRHIGECRLGRGRHRRNIVYALQPVRIPQDILAPSGTGLFPFSDSFVRSAVLIGSFVFLLVSIAYLSQALSMMRRSFKTRLACEPLRAGKNLGNKDRGEHGDDRDDNHNFYQSETLVSALEIRPGHFPSKLRAYVAIPSFAPHADDFILVRPTGTTRSISP
jgi:hypothetical protein